MSIPQSSVAPCLTQYLLKGMPLNQGFPSTDMLYLTPRHNGDWSPLVLSGTAADCSHSCLPALPTACVHQALTSHWTLTAGWQAKALWMDLDLYSLNTIRESTKSAQEYPKEEDRPSKTSLQIGLNMCPICSGFHTWCLKFKKCTKIWFHFGMITKSQPGHNLLSEHKALKGKSHLTYRLKDVFWHGSAWCVICTELVKQRRRHLHTLQSRFICDEPSHH